MKKNILFLILSLVFSQNVSSQSIKPRTIITTDGEIDDVDSFIRMLLYANEFRIEGLVYSSSMWHYKGDGKGTKYTSEMAMTKELYGEKTDLRWPGVHWMEDLIDAYEKIQPNLILHDKGFPEAKTLRSMIKIGNIDFEGEMEKDTDGSEFIKSKLLDDDLSPLYLQVWGGTNTIARALKSIEDQYKNTDKWEAITRKINQKAIIYAILDQDTAYQKYVAVHWPSIKIYYNSHQFACLAYPWKQYVSEPLHYLLEGDFMSKNIISNHGELLKMYYSYGDGQKQPGDDEHIHGDITKIKNAQWGSFNQFDFISEGDSPAFLHLINVGLGNLENPQFGGWGGRLIQSKTNPIRWEDGEDAMDMNPISQKMDMAYPQIRWLEAIQNDFAARADWCIKDFKNANHPPIVNQSTIALKIKPNKKMVIQSAAKDPDGDALTYQWWQYQEVGTYKGKLNIIEAKKKKCFFKMPADIKKGETIHLIMEVSDDKPLKLSRYQRFVITCD